MTGRAVDLYQTVIVYWRPAGVAIEQVPLKAVEQLAVAVRVGGDVQVLGVSCRCARRVVHVQANVFVP